MASSNTKLRLFVDTKAGKVLFADADKDFIDFFIYLLSLPIVTAVRILKDKNMHLAGVGFLGHLYEILEKLLDSFLQPNQNKSSLLNPRAPVYSTGIPLTLSDYDFKAQKWYKCSKCYDHVAEVPNLTCSSCKGRVNLAMSNVPPSPANFSVAVEGGFLKGLATYIVMEFMPICPCLPECLFHCSKSLVLKLLKASMVCKTVLTSVFLGNKKEAENSQP
ncbi:hypothetical protein ACOSQ4_032972 [Xanthoceras sorbifolium]